MKYKYYTIYHSHLKVCHPQSTIVQLPDPNLQHCYGSVLTIYLTVEVNTHMLTYVNTVTTLVPPQSTLFEAQDPQGVAAQFLYFQS